MRIFYFFLVFLFSAFFCNAQKKQKTFDEIYFEVAVNVTGQNPKEAIRIADSLFKTSTTAVYQVRSLMLKANIYSLEGDLKKSIAIGMQALNIAEKNKMQEGQCKILGFLSTQHRSLGLLKKGRTYLERGIALAKTFEDVAKSRLFYGLALQEMAYYDHDENKSAHAIIVLKKSDSIFQLLEDSNDKLFHLAISEEMLGKEYLLVKNPSESILHYQKSEKYLKKAQAVDSGLLGFVYNGKGEAFFNQKKLDSALHYYEKSKEIAEKSQILNLKAFVYKNLATYYFQKQNIIQYHHFTKLNDSINAILNQRNQKISDDIVENLSNDATRTKLSSRNIVVLLTVLLILFGTALLLNIIKKRKLKDRIKAYLVALEEKENNISVPEALMVEEVSELLQENEKQQLVPLETELLILKKLDKFERKEKFLSNSISLSSLAASLETNTKYLSHVINKNKNADFNTYINRLRIRYIVSKMKTDPNYLNYKLSYLAEVSGFSSHSKFSAVFKSIIGATPSEFISYLKKEEREVSDGISA